VGTLSQKDWSANVERETTEKVKELKCDAERLGNYFYFSLGPVSKAYRAVMPTPGIGSASARLKIGAVIRY
jgi:hypothetical protein